jgi:hypothetical protein
MPSTQRTGLKSLRGLHREHSVSMLLSKDVGRVASTVCAALILLALTLAGVAQSTSDDWTTWTGRKFGTTINYPKSLFAALPEPDAHDGGTFVSRDGARLAAFAYFNAGGTIESIDTALQDGPDYGHVILRRRGQNATVTSGVRIIDGREHVFYEKYFLEPNGGVVHAVVMTYPVEVSGIYGRHIARIVAPLEAARYSPP